MSAPSHLIEGARAVPLADVIARCGIMLRREGRELIGPCPQCGGSDRFSVNPTKEVFNCRGCGSKGHGAIDLAMFASARRGRRHPDHRASRKPATDKYETHRRPAPRPEADFQVACD